MAKLTTIKDKDGVTTLYPLTKTNAVSDSNGTDLDSLLSAESQARTSGDASLLTQISAVNGKLEPTAETNATPNTTYVNQNPCSYFKVGKIVFVHFNNVQFKNVAQSNTNILFSGLPTASALTVANVTYQGVTMRICINAGETSIKNYWSSFTPTTSQWWSAFFWYITTD